MHPHPQNAFFGPPQSALDMPKTPLSFIIPLAPAIALFSCAPKAIVVEEAPAPKPTKEKPVEVAESLPTAPDDGLRIPDMYTLPGNAEFRATSPTAPRTGFSGAVTARPPTEPPSRPKPKADGEGED